MNPPAVPRPPGVGGLPGRSPFHRLVRPLVRDAALHLDHGGGPDVNRVPRAGPSGGRRRCGGPDVDRVPRASPGGGRRRCGVHDACDGVERPASAPFLPRNS